jgi:hypothetical protein
MNHLWKRMLLVIGCLLVGTRSSGQTILEFQPAAVNVKGVTPGGSLVLFSVSREPAGHSARVVPWAALLIDQDQDGNVTASLETPIAPMSVWVAVDVATGLHAVATPDQAAFPLRAFTPPAGRLVTDARVFGGLRLLDERSELEMMTVRPGVGAWRLGAVEGGSADGDETPDGLLDVSFAGFEALGEATPKWPGFGPKDLLIGIDPRYLEVFVVRLSTVLPTNEGSAANARQTVDR